MNFAVLSKFPLRNQLKFRAIESTIISKYSKALGAPGSLSIHGETCSRYFLETAVKSS